MSNHITLTFWIYFRKLILVLQFLENSASFFRDILLLIGKKIREILIQLYWAVNILCRSSFKANPITKFWLFLQIQSLLMELCLAGCSPKLSFWQFTLVFNIVNDNSFDNGNRIVIVNSKYLLFVDLYFLLDQFFKTGYLAAFYKKGD